MEPPSLDVFGEWLNVGWFTRWGLDTAWTGWSQRFFPTWNGSVVLWIYIRDWYSCHLSPHPWQRHLGSGFLRTNMHKILISVWDFLGFLVLVQWMIIPWTTPAVLPFLPALQGRAHLSPQLTACAGASAMGTAFLRLERPAVLRKRKECVLRNTACWINTNSAPQVGISRGLFIYSLRVLSWRADCSVYTLQPGE